eukprot:TRINITY_DN10957_c0_g2_i1.p1 TRINITY_DN10957_c0_g2~~TRINITY_DN10957_c0_g2_i1.p1  ORF type:complete len:1103 (-),score=235.67 TRINITY_DN10957_c0_g2_i1:441-3749(-)
MGTKIHCKSYLPGYYSMRDLNEDASTSSWSPFYEDRMLQNGQYYNGFTPLAMDGYSEDDKEVLKRTMLHHEAIFRTQVYELHRVYRIQRDLMNELQQKELYKYSIPMETSSFNPFSSLKPSGDIQKMWQMPTMPAVNSTYSRPSFSGTEDKRSPLHFLKETKVQSDLSPIQNGVIVYDSELLDTKVKKSQKRTFDLQLPADVYIDSEDGEGIEMGKTHEVSLGSLYYQNKNYGVKPGSNMKLSLGSSEKPSYGGDDKKMDSHFSSSQHTHCLADLNEPIQEIFNEEASASSSIDRLSPVICSKEIEGQQAPMKQNLSIFGLSKDFFQDNQKCRDKKSLSNLTYSENEEYKREWLSYNIEAGKASDFCHEKLPMSSEPLLGGMKKPHVLPQFLSSDLGKTSTWLRGKATCVETSKRNSSLDIHNLTEQVASPMASLLPVVSRTDDTNTASSSISSWRKPVDGITAVPLAEVQTPPWLNRSSPLNRQIKSFSSSFQSTSTSKEKWDLNECLRSPPSSTSEMPFQNGLNYGFKSDCNASCLQSPLSSIDKLNLSGSDRSSKKDGDVHVPERISKGMHCLDVKSAKDMNLNVCLPNGFSDGIYSQGNPLPIDEGKDEDPLRGPSWLRMKKTFTEFSSVGGLAQTDIGFLSGGSQLFSGRVVESEPFHVKYETEKGPPGFMKDSLLALHTKDAKARRIELADCSNSKIFGVPVPHFSSSVSCQVLSEIAVIENGVTDAVYSVNTFSKPTLLNLEKKHLVEDWVSERELNRSSTGFRDHINLNSEAVEIKEYPPDSLENSVKINRAIPSSIPEAPTEFAAGIDLEAPVILSHVEDILPESENLGTDDPVKHVKLIECQTDDSHNTLARMAAESIVALSSCIHSCSDDVSYPASSSALRDSLLWFSEVVSSNAGDLESMEAALKERGDADNESSVDLDDFFEAMTLKLTETKVEVPCWRPWERENQKKEDTGTSTLLTRPRKLQRGRRQRRDFQKDILPGLVSLSRHEVTEDLQMIGGLMRASGCSWQSGAARRNAARNGWHGRARGRRRPRGSGAAASAGNWVDLLQKQPSNVEVEIEGGLSLQGWGKTTRRCRRQRFSTGNSSAALT